MAATFQEGLVSAFTASGLDAVFNGGLIAGDVPPGTPFPYARMEFLADAKVASTNLTVVRQPTVSVLVYHQTPDMVDALIRQVAAALEDYPMALDGSQESVLYVDADAITRQQQDTFWRASVEVRITTRSARVRRSF